MNNPLQQKINDAVNSDKPQKQLEGIVANAIIEAGITVISFNQEFGVNGEIGEIDIETPLAIIEVTTQSSRKLKQIQKLLFNSIINPTHKSVILYAPNYKTTPSQDIVNAGAYLAKNITELLEVLHHLGE
ncbi:MAG: hypothetical protein AB4060_17125 [Crocosphaera sp.]